MSDKSNPNVITANIDDNDLIEIINIRAGGRKEQITFSNLATRIEAGAMANIVTVDDASVMTNKTITAPKIGTAAEYVNLAVTAQTNADPTLTIPDLGDAADEVVTKDVEQTLIKKQLVNPKISSSTTTEYVIVTAATQTNADPTLTIPDLEDAADTLVCLDTTQVLTKKTLTSPLLTTPYIADGDANCKLTSANQTHGSATVTIPDIGDAADTFVMADTAQTLTNKTLTAPVLNAAVLQDTAVVNAVAASKVLTVNATPAEGETVTINGTTYKARLDALGAGVAASAVLTNDETAPADGDTVSIGDGVNTIVYRFKDTMAQANDVQRGTAAASMAALLAAINGTGSEGTEYYAGTEHAGDDLLYPFTAVATTDYVITCTADSVGFAANALTKAESSDHLDWDDVGAVFTGGIDAEKANDVFVNGDAEHFIDNLEAAIEGSGVEGTDYGTGTDAQTDVSVTAQDATTMTVTAAVKGVAGNSIAIAETLGDAGSVWAGGATFLSGGIDGTVGAAGEMRVDLSNSKIWVCTATNTIADANWKYASIS